MKEKYDNLFWTFNIKKVEFINISIKNKLPLMLI